LRCGRNAEVGLAPLLPEQFLALSSLIEGIYEGLDHWLGARRTLFTALLFLGCRLNDRNVRWLWCAVDKKFLLTAGRRSAIHMDVVEVAGRLTEEVEHGDPILGVGARERVAININISHIRYASKPCDLSGVIHVILSQINALKRQEALNAGKRGKAVATKVERRDGW
jgi:hypothetical protein